MQTDTEKQALVNKAAPKPRSVWMSCLQHTCYQRLQPLKLHRALPESQTPGEVAISNAKMNKRTSALFTKHNALTDCGTQELLTKCVAALEACWLCAHTVQVPATGRTGLAGSSCGRGKTHTAMPEAQRLPMPKPAQHPSLMQRRPPHGRAHRVQRALHSVGASHKSTKSQQKHNSSRDSLARHCERLHRPEQRHHPDRHC